MAFFEMFHKFLAVLKSVDIESVLPVTQPAEDLQVLLSTARMTLDMLPDLPASSDPAEVTDLAFDPGESLQVGLGARKDNVADLVSCFRMFEPEMPVDVLQRLVIVSVSQPTQLAGEREEAMTLLDVKLSGLALPGKSLATVGTEPGRKTPR